MQAWCKHGARVKQGSIAKWCKRQPVYYAAVVMQADNNPAFSVFVTFVAPPCKMPSIPSFSSSVQELSFLFMLYVQILVTAQFFTLGIRLCSEKMTTFCIDDHQAISCAGKHVSWETVQCHLAQLRGIWKEVIKKAAPPDSINLL